jgi:glycogen(starch) synthase
MSQSCDRIIHGLRLAGVQIHIIHFSSRKRGFKTNTQLSGSYTAIPFEEDESHTLNKAWTHINQHTMLKEVDLILAFGGTLPVLSGPVYSKWLNKPLATMFRGNDFDVAIFSPKRQNMLLRNLEASNAIISVSADKAKKIESFVDGDKVWYVPNGISSKTWKVLPSDEQLGLKWKSENVEPEKKVIGLFGILKAKKGLNFFVEVLSTMAAKTKVHLLFVGEIPEEQQNWLSELEISYSILPFLDRYELLAYYPVCDAVAIPSFYEGMPNVLLEAGLLGVPIIASNVDGMKDVLTDGKTGWLFEPGNRSGLRVAIQNFLQLEKEENTGHQLRDLIIDKYTEENETKGLIKVFESVLEQTTEAVIS